MFRIIKVLYSVSVVIATCYSVEYCWHQHACNKRELLVSRFQICLYNFSSRKNYRMDFMLWSCFRFHAAIQWTHTHAITNNIVVCAQRTVTSIPVSYTHLDVYKRQLKGARLQMSHILSTTQLPPYRASKYAEKITCS